MSKHVEGLLADAATWRAAVGARAPAYHRVLEELARVIAEGGAEARTIADCLAQAWRDRPFTIFYERPLLLLAALRLDALTGGPTHPLWPALAAPSPSPDAVSRAAVVEALGSAPVRDALRTRHVQTNETSRAVAWMWPAYLAGCDRGARPLAVVEIGTAAGLGLVADALPAPWTDGTGAPLPVVTEPDAAIRLGLDLRPLDVRDPAAVAWMRACIWAGETERLARFDASVAAFRARPPTLERADATAAPARLAQVSAALPPPGLVLAFQTIVRDYFDAATDQAYQRGMRAWLASAPRGRATWIQLELAPGGDQAHLAAITAHVAGGDGDVCDLVLGRTSYHPTDVLIDADAVAAFRQVLRV